MNPSTPLILKDSASLWWTFMYTFMLAVNIINFEMFIFVLFLSLFNFYSRLLAQQISNEYIETKQ